MRTEYEIRQKYNEMLLHTDGLKDLMNSPNDLEPNELETVIESYNQQCSYNDLLKWVLNE